nr:LuxR family transcriptional regulator [Galbitalea soli]
MVDRDEQLALALRRWESARSGDGQFLLVSGEAGIGKSRLLAEVDDRMRGSGRRLRVAVFPRDAEVAGSVLVDLARELRATGDRASAERLTTRLDGGLRETGDPVRRRRLLVAELAEEVGALLASEATMLRVEDLHWADELSLDVLERVGSRVRELPAMLVATFRSDELYPRSALRAWRARLVEQRVAEELRLRRLDPDGTAAMVTALRGAAPASAELAALFDRSDGIPLHVEELIVTELLDGAAVPETIAESVAQRAARLSRSAGEVLEAAAVIGRSCAVDLLREVSAASPGELDPALAELTDSLLLVPGAGGDDVDFRHALIRDAVYAGIPPYRRRALHGTVAEVAERSGFGSAFLSDQLERAHRPAAAYGHALRAAREAVRSGAHREGVALYRRAQRTMPSSTPVAERALVHSDLARELAAVDDNEAALREWVAAIELHRRDGDEVAAARHVSQQLAALHLLGVPFAEREAIARQALARIDGVAGQRAELARAELLAAITAGLMLDRRLDNAIAVGSEAARHAAGEGAEAIRIDLDLSLGSVLVFAGRGDEGWALLENGIRAATEHRLDTRIARGYRMIGSCASVLVEYDRAERWIAEGLEVTRRLEQWNDHHYLTAHLAHVRWATGRPAEARALADAALVDGRGGITTRVTALHVLGYLALEAGSGVDGPGDRPALDAALEHLTAAREIGERMGELQRLSPAVWGLAELALAEGRADDAVTLCETGWELSAAVTDAAYLFPFVLTGVRAQLARRDTLAARAWLARCRSLIAARGIPGTLPALDHAEGLLLLADRQLLRARESLERARAEWGRLRRAREREQCIRDLAEVDARTGRSLRRDELSPREFEVARLIAQGATNREIAATLVISAKTASAHVEHILSKLGAARRAEIAAWVVARDAPARAPIPVDAPPSARRP